VKIRTVQIVTYTFKEAKEEVIFFISYSRVNEYRKVHETVSPSKTRQRPMLYHARAKHHVGCANTESSRHIPSSIAQHGVRMGYNDHKTAVHMLVQC